MDTELEVERMNTEAKDRMWQCRYCSAHYPSQLTPVLALHLQWHIEKCPNQEPGQHTCPWPTNAKAKNRHLCRTVFDTAEELARHTLDYHTRKRWCSTDKRKYKSAMRDSLEEKDQLIRQLGNEQTTHGRAFIPAQQWRQEVEETPKQA